MQAHRVTTSSLVHSLTVSSLVLFFRHGNLTQINHPTYHRIYTEARLGSRAVPHSIVQAVFTQTGEYKMRSQYMLLISLPDLQLKLAEAEMETRGEKTKSDPNSSPEVLLWRERERKRKRTFCREIQEREVVLFHLLILTALVLVWNLQSQVCLIQ